MTNIEQIDANTYILHAERDVKFTRSDDHQNLRYDYGYNADNDYGHAMLKGYGNDINAAIEDACNKAASLFGITEDRCDLVEVEVKSGYVKVHFIFRPLENDVSIVDNADFD